MNEPRDDGDAGDSGARLLAVIGEMSRELAEGAARPEATLDSSLERDLGLDSLARMELLARIETALGATLSERVLAEAETPRDLLRGLDATAAPSPTPLQPEATASAGIRHIAPASVDTLTGALAWQAAAAPDAVHIHLYGDDPERAEAVTFAALHAEAEGLAAGLLAGGLDPGETVLIMLPTGRDYFRAFMGVLLAGGVPVPVYPPGRPQQLEEHLRRHAKIAANCRAAMMITDPAALKFSRLMSNLSPGLRRIATPEELAGQGGGGALPPVAAGDTAFVQYTSGSTGDPKGVVLSHANLIANVRAMGRALEATPADVFVSWLPLYHDMGLIGAWFGSLLHGMELAIMPPLAFLARPERWLRAIERHRGTVSGAPNFAYEACVRRIRDQDLEGLDLSSWRIAFNGAEPVSPKTLDAFAERFRPFGFRREALMPVYGLAENSVGLAFPPLGRGPRIEGIDRERLMKDGVAAPAAANPLLLPGCGYPLPGHQIRIVDADGRELPERREGRIEFMGPSATAGYLHNPETTKELFDGAWLASGDLGFIAEGELFVTGRDKDMIIRAGRNIFPAELEEAVGALDGIQAGNVAVFAARDPAAETETLVVMAETRHRDEARRESLRQAIAGLAVDLVGTPPDEVMLVPPRSVPKTSSGKIRRRAAKALYETGRAGAPGAAPGLQVLRLTLASLPGLARRAGRRAAASLFAAWVWLLIGLVGLPVWILVMLSASPRFAWAVTRTGMRVIGWAAGYPWTVEGRDNLPASGTYILAANHSSYADGPALMAALPGAPGFVAKGELRSNLIARTFLQRLGTEFVERFDPERGAEDAKRLTARLRAGRPLLYFPEGTLSRMPGLLPFHMGAFTAAVEAGVPIVPVIVRGTRSALRDTSWFPRRAALRVRILPPIPPPPENGATDWARALALRETLRAEMLRHTGEPDLGHERVDLPRPEGA